MVIEFLAAAKVDAEEIVSHYLSISPEVALRFESEFQRVANDIAESPRAWGPIGVNLRRKRLKSFPYGLMYRIHKDRVVVLAVGHLHRSPAFWKSRARQR